MVMSDERIIVESLKTSSDTLNKLVEVYFVIVSRIDEVIIGDYTIKDVYNDFLYSLREYSITHSKVIEPSDSPSCRKLLKLNNISIQNVKELTSKVNKHLDSHTDTQLSGHKKRSILEKQILEFTNQDIYNDYEEEKSKTVRYKMISKLLDTDEFQTSKNKYLNSIIKAMKEAEVNQLSDGKYLIIDKLLNTYNDSLSYMKRYDFQHKKDYLKKLNNEAEKVQVLQNYVKEMIEDIDIDADVDIKAIQWFIYYLIYGANKIDIFMIHSILGYKYQNAVKLYTKLFCKDHSTGKSTNFLHHLDFLNITENSLRAPKEKIASMELTDYNLAEIQKYISSNENLSYRIDNTMIIIEDSSDSYDKSIYTTIAHYI